MSESKHTPGPWRLVRVRGEKDVWNVVPKDQPRVIGSVWRRNEDTENTAEANAALIAAAPGLLEACKAAAAHLDAPSRHQSQCAIWREAAGEASCNCAKSRGVQALRALEAAIAKAEGRA